RLGGEVPRRVDAEYSHSQRTEAREQETVVAGNVKRPIAFGCARDAHGRGGELGAMLAEGLCGRADVEVVAEHEVWVDDSSELRETAASAHLERELRGGLGRSQLLGTEIRVRERSHAHVEVAQQVRRATHPTTAMNPRRPIVRAVGCHRRPTVGDSRLYARCGWESSHRARKSDGVW